jgi:hypothetical protein
VCAKEKPAVHQKEKKDMTKSIALSLALLIGSVTATVAQDVRYNFAQGEDF